MGHYFFCGTRAPSFRLVLYGLDANHPTWGSITKQLHQPAHRSRVGGVHLQVLLGKSGVPGAGEHVAAGLFSIIAASQGESYLCVQFAK